MNRRMRKAAMFFTYSQNNSGGSFHCDKKRGIGVYVIVEADSAEEANRDAESIGLYFDGDGDCSCCGRRWSEVDNADGTAKPMIYGKTIPQWLEANNKLTLLWDEGVFVHYKNGVVKEYPHG